MRTRDQFLKQPAASDANRLYYLPSRPSDSTNYYFEAHDGGALNVEMILAMAPPETPSLAEHLRVDPAGIVEPGQHHAMLKSMVGAMCIRGAGYDEIESIGSKEMKLPEPGWRKQPPTVDEVRSCQWWWCRAIDSAAIIGPTVLRLDVDDGVIVDADDTRDCVPPFDPEDWGSEWAPCLPPA